MCEAVAVTSSASYCLQAAVTNMVQLGPDDVWSDPLAELGSWCMGAEPLQSSGRGGASRLRGVHGPCQGRWLQTRLPGRLCPLAWLPINKSTCGLKGAVQL